MMNSQKRTDHYPMSSFHNFLGVTLLSDSNREENSNIKYEMASCFIFFYFFFFICLRFLLSFNVKSYCSTTDLDIL